MAALCLALLTALLCSLSCAALGQPAAAIAYTPSVTTCPPGTKLVRLAGMTHQTLSSDEEAYIRTRESRVTSQAWATYLANVKAAAKSNTPHVSLPSYVSALLDSQNPAQLPRLAVTASGGSYRAAIFAAGVLNALDGRNVTSVQAGTGGLLQAASYVAGLSGGSWLLSSLAQANFPMLPELIFAGSNAALESATGSVDVNGGWNAQLDLLQLSTDPQIEQGFIATLLGEVAGKAEAGFPVTVADVWTRSLSRHFCNGTTAANFLNPNITHGAGITLSGLVNMPSFKQHTMPFPVIVSDSKSTFQGNKNIITGDLVPLTNPIYEFTPFEMGSYDPMLAAFTPTKFLGSQNGKCVTGFDQLAFIAGASSDLFTGFNTSAAALAASPIGPIITALNATIPQANLELDAAAVPNPFLGVSPRTFIDSNQTILALIDGGSDGEVSPIQPMLVKARGIDVILVIDAPADTDNEFTNGTSLIVTQDRAALFPESYSFPLVPKSPNTFVSQGLANRPTFFGCNAADTSSTPLVIYIANGGPPLGQAPLTNTSTFQTTYSSAQIQGMLNQVFDVATQGIPVHETQKDPEWPVCLLCGVVDRSRAKAGILRTGACAQCLERYCWS